MNTQVDDHRNIVKKKVPLEKERTTSYNYYTDKDRLRDFYCIHEKLLKPSEAAKAANVNPETPRK